MAEWQNILVERRGSAGLVTLNRPEERNPLDRTTAQELMSAFEELFADDSIRSLAVTGAGRAFCAGGDLGQMGAFSSMPTRDAFGWPEFIVALNRRMLSAPKPVVALVNGPAYAGGMGLAGMCDVVLAVRGARFAMPEVKVGIFPMIIVAQLSRAVPRKHLMEMMFTGEPMAAEEAWRLGFVNHLYDDVGQMLEGLDTLATSFERASPDAIRLGRRAFSLLSELSADQALDAAQFFVMPFHLGADLTEGASAFLDKRSPSWAPSGDGRDGR
jgi:enoyl-CoA hydratase/carnithine racemase